MYSAQRVSTRNANIYLPFDRQFVAGGIQVTGNCGGKAPRPQYCTMGDGVTAGTFPAQLDTRRGIGFGNGFTDYATVPADCIVDAQPFTIATLVSNLPTSASPIFSTLHPVDAVGVYMILTQSTVEMFLEDGATVASALFNVLSANVEDKQQHSVIVACDGSGNASGLTLFLDGRLLPWTSTAGSVVGTIVSGLDAIIGASWFTVAPDPVTVDPYFEDGIVHTLAVYPFAFTEHMAGILDARMRAEIHVLEDAKYTPV